MKEYKIGEIETFAVVEIKKSADEREYIYLSNGERDTYTVRPYDYQLEWENSNLPKLLQCVVTDVNIWGLPKLAQLKWNVLNECYQEPGTEYSFKVIGKQTDTTTNAFYYRLRDPFGIEHRHYPVVNEKQREISDIFSLIVDGIVEKNNNTDYLKLITVADDLIVDTNALAEKQIAEEVIYTKDSLLGREDDNTEFKSSIIYPADSIEPDIDKQIQIIAKAIAGFQNRNGGTLYIGVNDSGNVIGINKDFEYLNSSQRDYYSYQMNIDGYENKIRNSVKYLLGQVSNSNIMFNFQKEGNKDYCTITINKVLVPIYLNGTALYERTGQLTQHLKGDAITWFIEQRLLERNNIRLSGNKDYQDKFNADETCTHDEVVEISNLSETKSDSNKVEITNEKIIDHLLTANQPTEDVWRHFTFYKDGGWSFQKSPVNSDTVLCQLPIVKSLKNERLIICYDNGCVNVVNPYEDSKGKTPRRIYKNGWTTTA
ncbi:MAG: ATP-binding protein, partial [Paludibacter sp.]|nr:ATP-binding protein [Paludibacter sp.]